MVKPDLYPRMIPDGTVIWTAPSGKVYTTKPGGSLFFPQLATPTGALAVNRPGMSGDSGLTGTIQ